MTIQRAYKYRFYPNNEQARLLAHTFGCVRFAFNNALAFSKEQYEQGNKTYLADWSKQLTALKKQSEFSWLKSVSSVALQQSLSHLDKAFKSFFESGFGYPRFKSKRNKQSACFMANAFKWDADKQALTLAKMKSPLNIKWSRPFHGTPSSCYVSKTPTGKYFISILVEEEVAALPNLNKSVGVDVGIKSLAVCSDGLVFKNPKSTKKYERKLAKAQRKLSKKTKGSNNFNKQRIIVAKIHEKIANCRVDFTHKMTTKLINENQVICTESLRVKNMVKNKKLAKAISDANFGEIVRQLEYKAAWYGRTVSKIDQWFPSSKLCACCGAVYQGKWSLAIREWRCDCGSVNDRDLNAANNIHIEGLRLAA
ncbi:RNA-guided endonuclease TnpB family protein [Vibrio alfacsensis]|uniref:RNA-guided endonuclease TnpB family protein n=1 Tax=Vibrio alfacsensis TaxID=1074311 RepID=UPI001BEE4CDB|nr:RNA-guided endonuclease TnpB family protein [Vibrio alfacsensis]BCN26790.1 transposase [Vibrio alfacsensis]